jgi:uncharacterized phage infection (PIP) family protein YhgE
LCLEIPLHVYSVELPSVLRNTSTEIAAAVAGFASLGVTAAQIYAKLSTLANQIRFARYQVLRIAQDVSAVEAAIQQLTDLLKGEDLPQAIDSDNKSLRLMQSLRASYQSHFKSIERSLKEASKEIKAKELSSGFEAEAGTGRFRPLLLHLRARSSMCSTCA